MTSKEKSKNQRRSTSVPKMSRHDITRVLKELSAFEDGQRSTQVLTWKHLARVAHFTDRTLRSKPDLRKRFEEVQRALLGKGGRARRSTGMVHDALQDANAQLRKELASYKELERAWLERWIRIASSLRAHGMSIDQFDIDLELRNE